VIRRRHRSVDDDILFEGPVDSPPVTVNRDLPDPSTLPEATLCHLVVDRERRGSSGHRTGSGDTETLLIHKKRGVGSGQWVGPGGKLEGDETPEACAVREVREEVGIHVLDPELAGRFVYYSDDWDAVVHVFRATAYEGTPEETEEADPRWFPVDDLPFEEMWATDREWLPAVLAGETFRGRFVYADGEPRAVDVALNVELDGDDVLHSFRPGR
jgi:8-oxo-dGTP diphosphatase